MAISNVPESLQMQEEFLEIDKITWKSWEALISLIRSPVAYFVMSNEKWRNAMTMELKETIMKKAKDRTDDFKIFVQSRPENWADLVGEEVIL